MVFGDAPGGKARQGKSKKRLLPSPLKELKHSCVLQLGQPRIPPHPPHPQRGPAETGWGGRGHRQTLVAGAPVLLAPTQPSSSHHGCEVRSAVCPAWEQCSVQPLSRGAPKRDYWYWIISNSSGETQVTAGSERSPCVQHKGQEQYPSVLAEGMFIYIYIYF